MKRKVYQITCDYCHHFDEFPMDPTISSLEKQGWIVILGKRRKPNCNKPILHFCSENCKVLGTAGNDTV